MDRVRPWLFLILLVTIGTLLLLAAQAGGDTGWSLLGVALFQGVLVALIVKREGETPASAWERLKTPPREDL